MNTRILQSGENKSRSVADSVVQKMDNEVSYVSSGFIDNRSKNSMSGTGGVLPIQRVRKDAEVVWGITHIVKQTEGSLFGEGDALENELSPREGGQLKKGDRLIVDDAPVIISRRGSNQERPDVREEGATGDIVHEWVKVLAITPQHGSKLEFGARSEMYVRKETIVLLEKQGREAGVRNEIELHSIKDWEGEQIPDQLRYIAGKWRKQGQLRRTKSAGVLRIDEADREERDKPSGRNWDQYDEGVDVANDMAHEDHEQFEPEKRQWRIKAVERDTGVLVGVLIVEEREGEPLYLRWMIGNPEIKGGGSALLSAVKTLLGKGDTENSIEVTSAYSAKGAYTKSGFEEQGDADVEKGDEFELTLTNEVATATPIPEAYRGFNPKPYNPPAEE